MDVRAWTEMTHHSDEITQENTKEMKGGMHHNTLDRNLHMNHNHDHYGLKEGLCCCDQNENGCRQIQTTCSIVDSSQALFGWYQYYPDLFGQQAQPTRFINSHFRPPILS